MQTLPKNKQSQRFKHHQTHQYRQRSRQRRNHPTNNRKRQSTNSSDSRSNSKPKGRTYSKNIPNGRQTHIKIQTKSKLQITSEPQPSQIKIHFKFYPIKMKFENQPILINQLKKYFQGKFGPVSHIQRNPDVPTHQLEMELGFLYDRSAQKAINQVKKLEILIDKKDVVLSATPSKIFNLWLKMKDKSERKRSNSLSSKSSKSKSNKKGHSTKQVNKSRLKSKYFESSTSRNSSNSSQKDQKSKHNQVNKKRRSLSRQSSKSRNSQKSSRSSELNKQKQGNHNINQNLKEDYHESKKQTDNSSKPKNNQEIGKFKNLYIFGIPYNKNARNVMEYLQDHKNGPFQSNRDLIWKKIQGTNCQFIEAKFEQKMASKLLRFGDNLQLNGSYLVILEAKSIDKQELRQEISKYQINLKFPKLVDPYYVLKALNQLGNVIQIVSNTELTKQGLSDSYNLTLTSKQICQSLINIGKTKDGIIIEAQRQGFIPIYRQSDQKVSNQKSLQFSKSQVSKSGEAHSFISSESSIPNSQQSEKAKKQGILQEDKKDEGYPNL